MLFRHDQIAKGVCRTHFLSSTVVVSRMKGIVMKGINVRI